MKLLECVEAGNACTDNDCVKFLGHFGSSSWKYRPGKISRSSAGSECDSGTGTDIMPGYRDVGNAKGLEEQPLPRYSMK